MIQLLAGDCRSVLATLPAESVQCVVTSPPYWNLRDYGTALWDGGDAACDHVSGMARQDTERETPGGRGGSFRGGEMQYRDTCGKCGARRIDRQIGMESSPESYLATMVAVFREVKRVLRKDGTLWLNIGDSYSGSGEIGRHDGGRTYQDTYDRKSFGPRKQKALGGLKPKDLLLMPARLALALQADGWWVRSDIIWHKPNPMPESCTDRPTSAYEHVYLLTRSSRYYYDAEAVRETSVSDHPSGNGYKRPARLTYGGADGPRGSNEQWEMQTHRSCRNVWTIPTSPFSAAHFATFPSALAERCIRAGTSERGACSQCGKPWVRVTERTFTPQTDVSLERGIKGAAGQKPMDASSSWDGVPRGTTTAVTTGWSPACACNAEVRPCVVLDPFAGAGTTLLVADRLQRDAIGIELNPSYTEMAMQRCRDDAPLFTAFPPAEDPEDARMQDLFADAAE